MKRPLLSLVSLALVFFVPNIASAYEFTLQFIPAPNSRNLIVAGYRLSGKTVIGNCSYVTYSACSGRGCHSVPTNHFNTCTWDLSGNLLSVAAGAPATPPVLFQTGTEIVYATSPNGTVTTGHDTRNFGFVSAPASHYTWQTPNGGYAVVSYAPYSVAATLLSDGDIDLNFSGAKVTPQIYGTITPSAGSASIANNTCVGAIPPGSTCTVTVTYNPTTIACTGSPYGYAYTGIDLSLMTDAPLNPDFTQRFTVTGVPICDD